MKTLQWSAGARDFLYFDGSGYMGVYICVKLSSCTFKECLFYCIHVITL